MNFTAMTFVLGFPIVLLIHWLCPARLRWIWLLVVSMAFYAVGSPEALWLLLLMIVGTYVAAIGIAYSTRRWVRRLWCSAASVLCLGCLAWFKYAGFLAETAVMISGVGGSATDGGYGGSTAAIAVLLPAGISFYTFQTLSYVYDVAAGRVAVERNLGKYALFVSFFPQLVAGPIERSGDLLPQLRSGDRTPDWNGAIILLRGFAMKLLLADPAATYVDVVYGAPQEASGVQVVIATVLFAVQIYCDFAGYSDIAIGAAAMMGVRLRSNFDRPYSALSLREFWRRWHKSLTQWFTDYVYIPLGGSRCGLVRHCCNILNVFLLSGLWHGAAWHYVAWGGLHGLFLVGETLIGAWWLRRYGRHRNGEGCDRLAMLESRRYGWEQDLHMPAWLAHALTLLLVGIAWVFFRAPSVTDAVTMLAQIPSGWSVRAVTGAVQTIGLRRLVQMLLAGWCIRLLPERLPDKPHEIVPLFWLIIATITAWGASLGSATANAFIYFQF